jgi:hypothetical protein
MSSWIERLIITLVLRASGVLNVKHEKYVEIQQEDPSENYAPTLGWSLRLFLGGSLFLDDEKILFIDDVYL